MLAVAMRVVIIALVVTSITVTCKTITRETINEDVYFINKPQRNLLRHIQQDQILLKRYSKLQNELLHESLARQNRNVLNEGKSSLRKSRVTRQAHQANGSLYPNLPYNAQQGGNFNNNPYGYNQPGSTNIAGQQPPYNTQGYQQPYNPSSQNTGSYPGNTQYTRPNGNSNFNYYPPYNPNLTNQPQFNFYNATNPHYPTYNHGQKPPFAPPTGQYQPNYNQTHGQENYQFNNQNPQRIPSYPQPGYTNQNQYNPTNQGYTGQRPPYGTYNPTSMPGQQYNPAVTQSPYGQSYGQYPNNYSTHSNSSIPRIG